MTLKQIEEKIFHLLCRRMAEASSEQPINDLYSMAKDIVRELDNEGLLNVNQKL
jgi:hypothetical protein